MAASERAQIARINAELTGVVERAVRNLATVVLDGVASTDSAGHRRIGEFMGCEHPAERASCEAHWSGTRGGEGKAGGEPGEAVELQACQWRGARREFATRH